jgi:U3 small nucleolar RNA-associated protein 18
MLSGRAAPERKGSEKGFGADAHRHSQNKPRGNGGKGTNKGKAKDPVVKTASAAERHLAAMLFDDAAPITTLVKPLAGPALGPASTVAVSATDSSSLGPKSKRSRHAGDKSGAPSLFDVLDSASGIAAAATSAGAEPVSVWADADDETHSVSLASVNRFRKVRTTEDEDVVSGKEFNRRMRKQFKSINQDAAWAELPADAAAAAAAAEAGAATGAEAADATDAASAAALTRSLLSTSAALTHNTRRGLDAKDELASLPQGRLALTRITDANQAAPNASVTSSARFHANGELFLTGGLDGMLRLFHIDGARNPLVQGVKLGDLPVRCADFVGDSEVLATGRRDHFYSYDLVKGAVSRIPYVRGREGKEKSLELFRVSPDQQTIAVSGVDGTVLLLSARSKQLIGTVRAPTHVNDIAFGPAGSGLLYTAGHDGGVLTFDLRTRRAVARRQDEGAVHVTAIAASYDGNYLATGSDSGIANIFAAELDADDATGAAARPLRTVDNLTTCIDRLAFSGGNEMLAVSSYRKKDQLRLVHLPSLTTFTNWPQTNTPLSYIQDVSFSANGGMMAVANDKGRVLLYRINHYKQV